MEKLMQGRDAWYKSGMKGKGRESQRNNERLKYKFIVKYVEGIHPEIFADAVKFYDKTEKINPGVSDLTKTTIFMSTVTPGEPIPRYYGRRKLRRQQPPEPEMVLNIPLLKSGELAALSEPAPVPEQVPLPECEPAPVPEQVPLPECEPVPVPEQVPLPVCEPVPVPEQVPLPVCEPVPVPEQVPLPLCEPNLLSPEVYKSLFDEIQRDPEMATIFNSIVGNEDVGNDSLNIYESDNDEINKFVWDDIVVQEMDLF